MELRSLGHDGPHLSVIGFGTWHIGSTPRWGVREDVQIIQTLRRATEQGINWIDTSPVHAFGHAETLAGKALAVIDTPVFVANRCGLHRDPGDGSYTVSLRPEVIRAQLEKSLQRLGRDHIDLYQLHFPDPEVPVEDAWGTLVRLREQGLVRYIGLCHFNLAQIKRCMDIHPVQSIQLPYSLMHRAIQEELLPWCRENRVGVLAASPLQDGELAVLAAPADESATITTPRSQSSSALPQAMELIDRLQPEAERRNISIAQLSLAWILHYSEITAAVVAARMPEQLLDLTAVAENPLTAEEMVSIGEVIAETIGV